MGGAGADTFLAACIHSCAISNVTSAQDVAAIRAIRAAPSAAGGGGASGILPSPRTAARLARHELPLLTLYGDGAVCILDARLGVDPQPLALAWTHRLGIGVRHPKCAIAVHELDWFTHGQPPPPRSARRPCGGSSPSPGRPAPGRADSRARVRPCGDTGTTGSTPRSLRCQGRDSSTRSRPTPPAPPVWSPCSAACQGTSSLSFLPPVVRPRLALDCLALPSPNLAPPVLAGPLRAGPGRASPLTTAPRRTRARLGPSRPHPR